MSTFLRSLATVVSLLSIVACSSEHSDEKPKQPAASTRVGETRGSAVVLSRDERVAVVVNRSAGVVTVFRLDPEQPADRLVVGQTALDMDAAEGRSTPDRGSEPWAAVIGADDDTAYVVSRYDQTVTRISDLHGTPRLDGSVPVGSEPTAIAIAPNGVRLFVANWGEGTISVITTPDFRVRDPVDLNPALAEFGSWRDSEPGGLEPRPGLAHPRALALTDDGDNDNADETLYATEFFSVPDRCVGMGQFACGRQGVVYAIPLAEDGAVEAIRIAPVENTGFPDANQAVTGCFPNQLYAAAAEGDRLLVTSMCVSPQGPLGPKALPDGSTDPANFKTLVHPSVFVIDTRTNQELVDQRLILTRELDEHYQPGQVASPRVPLIPNDIAFTTDVVGADELYRGCITAMGADAVFCIEFDRDWRFLGFGKYERPYIDLLPLDQRSGRLPVGIALSKQKQFGLVVNDNSQNLSVVDLTAGAVRWVGWTARGIPHADETLDSPANAGRRLFATGLDVWSFKGQAWMSCEGCHPDGLSDGVTWFFSRGPRRTLSTASTYYGDGERRMLLWTGNVDEVHDVEGIVRSVAGGIGGVTWEYPTQTSTNASRIVYDGTANPTGKPTTILRHNLNGSVKELLALSSQVCDATTPVCDSTPVREWDEIDAFIRSVRAPRRPAQLARLAADVQRGAELFRVGQCASCHGGPGWTLSRVFYTPSGTNNGALPYVPPPGLTVTPALLGRLRMETYSVPEALRPLNPPGASGTATLRRWDPGTRDPFVHLYGTEMNGGYDSRKTHGNDQINCVLRSVGTFPDQTQGENTLGISAKSNPVYELRDDMKTLALGATGFNIPSLQGLATGAPYFHGGNARTLEEVFEPMFAAHHQALAPGFLASGDRAASVRDLVAYLLSIDDDKPSEPVPSGFDLCVPVSGPLD
jgi:hypothetical protein